jgi:hypothetical protein
MAVLAPPPKSPPATFADGDGLRRLQFRLHILGLTTFTVVVTAWLCTLGMFPAIIALVTAKHVLVAILAMAMEMGPKDEEVAG